MYEEKSKRKYEVNQFLQVFDTTIGNPWNKTWINEKIAQFEVISCKSKT